MAMEQVERARDAFQQQARISTLFATLRSVREGSRTTLELGQAISSNGRPFSLLELLLQTKYVDKFGGYTKNNSSVEKVILDPGDLEILDSAGDPVSELEYYQRWTKLAHGLSNLKGLKQLKIDSRELLEDPENNNIPDYRAIGIVIRAVPQLEHLTFSCSLRGNDPHIMHVADALRNHPNLNRVSFGQTVDADALDLIARQLVTVKSVSKVEFGFAILTRRILPDSFFALSGMESLTFLILHKCLLSEAQCRLMAEQLSMEVSKMNVIDLCHSRTEGLGATHLLASLREHKHIKALKFTVPNLNESACTMLGEFIAVNQSIEELILISESFIDRVHDDDAETEDDFDAEWLAPLFWNLQRNHSLKQLSIPTEDWSDHLVDSFGAFLQSPTCHLEDLILDASVVPPGWPRLLPSLGINKSLKKLTVTGSLDRQGAIGIASHISRNTSIEEICIMVDCNEDEDDDESDNDDGAMNESKEEDDQPHPANYPKARFVEALGRNTTVREVDIRFNRRFEMLSREEEGFEQMEEAVRNNYSISSIRGTYDRLSDVPAILLLNQAGRKYLIEDPSNTARALLLLAEVSDCLDALFIHLSENPSFCGGQPQGMKRTRQGLGEPEAK